MHDRRNTFDEIHEVESGFLLLLCVANGSHYILAADNTIFTAFKRELTMRVMTIFNIVLTAYFGKKTIGIGLSKYSLNRYRLERRG